MGKQMKKLTYFLFTLLLLPALNAQVTNQGQPLSWSINSLNPVTPEILDEVIIEYPQTDIVKGNTPFKFGQEVAVDFSSFQNGTWDNVDHGRIWRFQIISPGATSINFIFSDFYIPEGGHLYIYNHDKTDLLGAYTYAQNRPEGQLGTWPVSGENVWLEYYEPKIYQGKGRLHIAKVVHGFKSILEMEAGRGFDDSSVCNYDVNCDIGSDFSAHKENLKRSVALLIMGGNICSGTLINNVENNQVPYFLTANHCDDGNPGTWAFRFNWVSPNPICGTEGNSSNQNFNQTISGATKLMSNDKTDVMLVKILGNLPQQWNLFWAGWNRSTTDIPNYTVSIHHPSGDIMKISRDNNSPTKVEAPFNNNPEVSFWKINNWEIGLTESGSSGGALFDPNGRIIGQLAGGMSQCINGANNGLSDYFGRFDISWDYGDSPETRLADWLDPNNTGVIITEGLSNPTFEYTGNILVFPNPASHSIYVNNNSFAGLNFQIYNTLGQIVLQGPLTQNNNTINISPLSEGTFFLRLFDTESDNSMIKQIVIKK